MIENIRNSVSNRGVATQNVSMFNLYKNLSYTATIRSMGNALIQPTMYFKLQHLPMFEGPYFITEVSHTISPGAFETVFLGPPGECFGSGTDPRRHAILSLSAEVGRRGLRGAGVLFVVPISGRC
jgi:hypothetical protein